MAKYRLIKYNNRYYVQVKHCWLSPWKLYNFYKAYNGINEHEYRVYETLGHQPIPFESFNEGKYVVDFLNTHKNGDVFYTTLINRANNEYYIMHYCLDARYKNSREYFEAYSKEELEKQYPVFIKNAKVVYE